MSNNKNKLEPIDLTDKSILITGGAGSFGKHFVKALIADSSPRRVIVFSRDEYKQHVMAKEFTAAQRKTLRFFIGDVRERERLEMAMRGVDYVVHAAALKHIEIAEYNPFECIKTNIMGAENVVQAAISAGVKRVIALSTDKAANPVNLYGASKLAADKVFAAANNLSGADGPRFASVRYGNVLGSRGSIVPVVRDLVEKGAKSVPITDPRMTRFWITLDQGVEFVLSCLAMMRGGEIFVPKIPSMRISDLLASLAPGLPQETIGIRPGEKLHEIMITRDDARNTVDLGDRYVIEPTAVHWTRRSYLEDGAEPVAEFFEYTSENNDDWLDAEQLESLLIRPES